VDAQRQSEEQHADADAHQQRMFGATKSARDKTGNSHDGGDRKSSSRTRSAGLPFHNQKCTAGANENSPFITSGQEFAAWIACTGDEKIAKPGCLLPSLAVCNTLKAYLANPRCT
jgi:hypothetical protein